MAAAYAVLREKGTLRDDLDLVLSFDDFAPTVDLDGHYDLEARYVTTNPSVGR